MHPVRAGLLATPALHEILTGGTIMSTLEGGRDHRQVFPIENPFGVRMQERARLPLQGATDVAVEAAGGVAYVAAKGALFVVDVSRPERPVLVGQLQGLGQGRQVEVARGIAAVTTRPDGLFVCDVSDPEHPSLLSHYDTVELATGVCLSGALCLVACRHMGVEIVDLSDPRRPTHVSNVLAGEAQSVFVDGSTMYVGAWMQREVRIVDIANPAMPRTLGVCPLDGFGDGIYVQDGLCYAATGHHARRFTNRRKYLHYDYVTAQMLQEGYGGGHGLEIFDVTDPERPRLLSRLKTPPLHMAGNDLWDVIVAGDHAYLVDTYNGVFVVNVAHPQGPYFEGYHRLDPLDDGVYRPEPSIQQLCQPATGLALVNDHLLVVSPQTGLHVIEAPVETRPPEAPRAAPTAINTAVLAPPEVVFRPGGQVHGLAVVGGRLVVAAGTHGLYALASGLPCGAATHADTEGFALDVQAAGPYIYVAEGRAGLSVWELASGGLRMVGRCQDGFAGEAVRQVVLLADTGLAALHVGTNHLALMDISTPEAPRCLSILPVGGMMYYKSIVDGLFAGRYVAVFPLSPGIVWYDVHDPTRLVRAAVSIGQQLCTIEEGAALGKDGIFTIFRGRYAFSRGIDDIPGERGALTLWDDEDRAPGREVYLTGRPTLIKDSLYLLNRQIGQLSQIDVRDPDHPILRRTLTLTGHPERIVWFDEALWLCCGHGGLQRLVP
jgi:hypothetical protein